MEALLISHGMLRRSLLRGGLLTTLWITTATASPAEQPTTVVAYVAAQGLAAADPRVPRQQRFSQLRLLFDHYFDIGHVAAFALGRYRLLATPQELQQYNNLYDTFTVLVYGNRLAQYAGARVRITGGHSDGAEPVVASEISRPNGSAVKIDWHLVDRHGRWKISDVAIDNVSMRSSQRQYFAQWIETNGGRFDALLEVMQQQIAAARQS
jgi:phospholipid transport system substrate-binding protein